MAYLALECPHCLTEKAGFFGTASVPLRTSSENDRRYHVLMGCGVCSRGVIVEVQGLGVQDWLTKNTLGDIAIIAVFPKPPPLVAPPSLPDNIRSFYLQGLDTHRRGQFDAAGTMFRKSLDTALRRLHPAGKGVLKQRIHSLPNDIGITPAMREWADEIRDLGNDAAHEEDPFTAEESATLQAFTELFLTYAFTLPAMLAARKAGPGAYPAA